MVGLLKKLDKCFFFISSLYKTLMRFFFINIVKEGHLLLSNFNPIKNQENKNTRKKEKKSKNTRGYT
jgi:hypothetical protein